MIEKGKLLAGRYRLLDPIDSGGTAYVFQARDEFTGDIVAVKILRPELKDNEEFVTRFKKEVHASLKLNHANIIKGYDAGLDDGMYYIVMELIDGITLKQMVNEDGPLPLYYAINLAKKLCLALEYAHVKGFVHRDIKPHNILIDKSGEPYIADFGIAKNLEANTITMEEDSVMGSVHYFSPEQARGERADKRTDIYSLGIVLYEIISGEVPFDGDTPVSIALKHLNEPMPDLHMIVSDAPESVAKIIGKATQKDKFFRYKSAFSMYEDLQRCLNETDGEYIKYTESKRAHQYENRGGYLRKTKKGVKHLFIAIGAGVAVAISAIFIISLFAKNTKAIEVIDVTGQQEKKAADIISESGLQPKMVSQESDEAYGTVLGQSPSGGEMLDPGEVVTLFISSGSGDGIMPNVMEMDLQQAKAALEFAGINTITINKSVDGEYPIGSVIKQQPNAGMQVDNNTPVEITIKISPEELKLKIPDVTGNQVENALKSLSDVGFTNFYIYEEKSGYPSGVVISQEPEPSTDNISDQPIKLTVSKFHDAEYIINKTITVDIIKDKTTVVAAITAQIGEYDVYYPVFEGILSAGVIEIPIEGNLYLDDTADSIKRDLMILQNNLPYKVTEVELEKENG